MENSQKNYLKKKLSEITEDNGASLFAVANLTPFKEEIAENYDDRYLYLDKAISIGVPYPKDIVNELDFGPTHTYLYYYKILNTKLDDIALNISIYLESKGYKTFPIPASQRVTDSRLNGIFSHRLAAHLSGLGWIGKNCSLITKEYGPRLRLVTVLTDAPLECDPPYEGEGCKNCEVCSKACPSGAILGKAFNRLKPIEDRFIGERCDKHLSKVRNTFGKRICGMCISSCPYGK